MGKYNSLCAEVEHPHLLCSGGLCIVVVNEGVVFVVIARCAAFVLACIALFEMLDQVFDAEWAFGKSCPESTR